MSAHTFRSRGSSSGSSDAQAGSLSDGVSPMDSHWTIKLVDLGFLGLICVLPFVMGGRQAPGLVLLAALSAYTACAWSLAQFLRPQGDWIRSRTYLFLAAAIGLLVLQLVNLPPAVLNQISPHIAEVLPLWSAGNDQPIHIGTWTQISLTPHETFEGLIVLLSYALIFVVAMQRIRRLDDVQKFFRWMALAAILMACFGLLQFVFGNGKFFWFYEHPYSEATGGVKGSFTNRNHLAHFLALGIGPLICWGAGLLKSSSSSSSSRGGFEAGHNGNQPLSLIGLLLGAGLVLMACLLSLSRGGMIAMLVAVGVMLLVMIRARLLSGPILIGLGLLAVCLASGIVMFGEDMVQDRVDDVVSGELDRLDQKNRRQDIWEAVGKAVQDYPILGTGIGSHREVYPTYMEKVHPVEFSHAENGYLQVALESGLVGLTCLLLAWCTCLWCGYSGLQHSRSQQLTLSLAAVLAGLCASLAHSLVDFVWYVPSCVVAVLILAACGFRLRSIAFAQGSSSSAAQYAHAAQSPAIAIPRILWGAACPAALLLGIWMTSQLLPRMAAEPHWHEYLRLTLNQLGDDNQLDKAPQEANSQAASEENPDADETAETDVEESPTVVAAKRSEEKLTTFKKKLDALTKAVKANPRDARIRMRTSMAYFTVFQIMQSKSENQMSLNQIADAARSSQFESNEQLQAWVNKVVGKSRKYLDGALANAREGLKLSPLQGHGYLYLAELSFLEQSPDGVQNAYVNQALITRPYDPQILFVAGRDAFLHGDSETALIRWKSSFHRSPVYQARIVDLLADIVPATYFTENFEPSVRSLELLLKRYQHSPRPDDIPQLLAAIAVKAHAEAESAEGEDAVRLLLMAHRAYHQLQQADEAWTSLSEALEIDENSYEVHYTAGVWLYQQSRFEEAAEHLAWCSAHNPADRKLSLLAERAKSKSPTQSQIRPVKHSNEDELEF